MTEVNAMDDGLTIILSCLPGGFGLMLGLFLLFSAGNNIKRRRVGIFFTLVGGLIFIGFALLGILGSF